MPEPNPQPPDQPTPDEARHLTEYQRRVARRTLNLLELGFSMEQILCLKPAKAGFDWHNAERLVKNGCPLDTAVRILEP